MSSSQNARPPVPIYSCSVLLVMSSDFQPFAAHNSSTVQALLYICFLSQPMRKSYPQAYANPLPEHLLSLLTVASKSLRQLPWFSVKPKVAFLVW
ncbi:hypothetical protein ACH5RR_015269 [Cinchona calisaya]|uniref:Uncharacterized protein n=1 Tax=Cinchona calisaya TaxID=153742 RepID=A0ABD2ZW49_9GENT